MKIQDHVNGVVNGAPGLLGRGKGAEALDPQRATGPSDSIQFSDRSREIRWARSVAVGAPAVRRELVDGVAGLLERGEYAVTGAQVASKMIQEHLADATR